MKEKYSKSRARRQAFVRRTIPPERPDIDAPEADRAAWWRQHVLRMTRDEMADLTIAAGVQFNWLEAHVALRQEAVRV